MKRTSLALMALCVGLLWLGGAQAARFQTHATNAQVPKGTVYDTTTKLLWEMKTRDGSVHDVNNHYTWSDFDFNDSSPEGTAFIEFLYALNMDVSFTGDDSLGCFANHCDWRLPEIAELRGIIETGRMPSIDPIFGPTQGAVYWSATTFYGNPDAAWYVTFGGGFVDGAAKFNSFFVRAVRSGL